MNRKLRAGFPCYMGMCTFMFRDTWKSQWWYLPLWLSILFCVSICMMHTCAHVGMCVSIWKCTWTHTRICEGQRSNQVSSSIAFHFNFGIGFQNLSLQIRPGWFIHDLKEPVHPSTVVTDEGWHRPTRTNTWVLPHSLSHVGSSNSNTALIMLVWEALYHVHHLPGLDTGLSSTGLLLFLSHNNKSFEYVSQVLSILHRPILPWSTPVYSLHINTASKGYFIS